MLGPKTKWLSRSEFCEKCDRISRTTLWRMMKRGILTEPKIFRLGRKILIDEDCITKLPELVNKYNAKRLTIKEIKICKKDN